MDHHHPPISSYEDVITEILSHLPVKSLFRFKTVNKSWNKIISSSSFTKLHLLNHYNNNTNNLKSCPSFLLEPHCRLNTIVDNNNNEKTCPPKIAGPVKDHIIIYGDRWPQRVMIVDLRDMQGEFLPTHPMPIGKGYCSGLTHYRSLGFGFNSHEELIVLQLLSYRSRPQCKLNMVFRFDIYFRNTWRRWDCGYGDIFVKKAISSNHGSFCYWLVQRQTRGGSLFVLSFDIRDCHFGMIRLPSCFDGEKEGTKFMIFGEGDSLVLLSYSELVLERWVLKDIGEDGEWTKLTSIGPFLRLSKPVALLENRGVVLKYDPEGKYLFFYDYSTQQLRNTDILNHRRVKVLEYEGDLMSIVM